jgi:hypothetical protein
MQKIESLKKDLRFAKHNLLKISKILLNELEQIDAPDVETQQDINLLSERVGFLESEIWYDLNSLQGKDPGTKRLEKALEDLRQQLSVEREIFNTDGNNADRLLDINFRVQEIEEALNARK